MNRRRILGASLIAGFAGVLVAAVMAALTDVRAVGDSLRSLPWQIFIAMLALSFGSFLLRATRWRWLMKLSGVHASYRDALYAQLGGQTMTITPGRVGEVMRPWLSSRMSGLPMSKGLALVFGERVADLIAVIVLSLGALSLLGDNQWALPVSLGAVVVGSWVAGSSWFHDLAVNMVKKQKWMAEHHGSVDSASTALRTALSWKVLPISVIVAVVAWGLEGVGAWLAIEALAPGHLSPLGAIGVYNIAVIIGAFTFLPGGIGITEASMAGLLIATGIDAPTASAATLIVRVATLWWGVAVGWIALATRPSLFASLFSEPEDE